MSLRVATFLALTLVFSACQGADSPDNPEDNLSSPTLTSSPIAVQQSTTTSRPTEIFKPTAEADLSLPPSGQYLDRVDVGEQGIYALTIDDGFGRVPFDEILNELSARDIQATFFLVAEAMINLGFERMEQLAIDGHTIAYHSYAHDDLSIVEDWDESEWLTDYAAWEEAMRILLGEEVFSQAIRPYARAPYGLFNRDFLGMTEEMGLIPVGWSRDPGDLNIGLTVRPGDIFLLHVRVSDAELLPGLLDEIELTPVSLDELFAARQPD